MRLGCPKGISVPVKKMFNPDISKRPTRQCFDLGPQGVASKRLCHGSLMEAPVDKDLGLRIIKYLLLCMAPPMLLSAAEMMSQGGVQ